MEKEPEVLTERRREQLSYRQITGQNKVSERQMSWVKHEWHAAWFSFKRETGRKGFQLCPLSYLLLLCLKTPLSH